MNKYYCVYERLIDGSGELRAVFTIESEAASYAAENKSPCYTKTVTAQGLVFTGQQNEEK